MPEYINTTVSLDAGKVLTAAEQAAVQLQQQTQRLLYPDYHKLQDKITALIAEVKKYNATAPQGKRINSVTLDMDANTMSQRES